MKAPDNPHPIRNPFASKYIAPGARPFLLPDHLSLEQLVHRLQSHNWRGQIIGPHGSGKSSLVQALLPFMRQSGRVVKLLVLQPEDRRVRRELGSQPLSEQHVLVVDGFEQLSRWSQRRVKWRCRRTGSGLLVTTHRNVKLPLLHECQPHAALLRRIVDQMIEDEDWTIDDERLERLFVQNRGNLRECLFQLYDLYRESLH